MDQQVTRQILWNIPISFDVFLYGMLIPLTAAFVYVGLRWFQIVRLGSGGPRRPGLRRPRVMGLDALRDLGPLPGSLHRQDDHLPLTTSR